MSYIKNILLSDEKIIYRRYPHWIVVLKSWVVLIIIAAFLLIRGQPTLLSISLFSILALIVCLSGLIIYYSSEYGITDKRVVMKSGFISRVSLENVLDRIEEVEISQSIMGRILDYGSIRIRGG